MNLETIVERFRERTVAVAGDMVADVYIFGKPIRLSREAPVPIVRFDGQSTVPGSAANTVYNLLALGARTLPFGAVGDDSEGLGLVEVFKGAGADLRGLAISPGRQTTSKTRILAGDDHISKQQVVRIDKEGPSGLDRDEERRILDALEAALPSLD
ncbi:MAG: sugar kinase, partial [Myxococcales bacterium]|nr:sugar kinase [Myxococcales bacterium]